MTYISHREVEPLLEAVVPFFELFNVGSYLLVHGLRHLACLRLGTQNRTVVILLVVISLKVVALVMVSLVHCLVPAFPVVPCVSHRLWPLALLNVTNYSLRSTPLLLESLMLLLLSIYLSHAILQFFKLLIDLSVAHCQEAVDQRETFLVGALVPFHTLVWLVGIIVHFQLLLLRFPASRILLFHNPLREDVDLAATFFA